MIASLFLKNFLNFEVHDKNPSISAVRKFVYLLEHNNLDYTEEIGKIFRDF